MEDRPIFDPYGFMGPVPGVGTMPFGTVYPFQNLPPSTYDFFSSPAAIKDFYDSQYMYFRYLNEMLDYRIKLKELENLSSQKKEDISSS